LVRRLGALLPLMLIACGGGSASPVGDAGAALTCNVDPPLACPAGGPTYAAVQPIFARSCVPCHDGADPDGPWPLRTYKSAADWAEVIRADLISCEMPPADGGIPLSDEDRHALLTWIRCDYPP
jgi:cytochrome c5